MKIAELCRKHTELNMTQIAILDRMSVVFPFVADLAHGQLKVYVKTKETRQLMIVAQSRPHTVYT